MPGTPSSIPNPAIATSATGTAGICVNRRPIARMASATSAIT